MAERKRAKSASPTGKSTTGKATPSKTGKAMPASPGATGVTRKPVPSGFSFDRVRGQERAIAQLRDAVRTGHLSQAYLFHGPRGVGKTTAALALATALNCEAGPADRPCGQCLPCRKAARFNHPDIHFVMPLYPAALWKEEGEAAGPGVPAEGALCRLLGEWVDNPFHVYQWPKRPSIATEWVLSIKREASLKTFEGRTKVIVVSGVEEMSPEAANRFLKMLEEPGPHTVFVLTTSRLHQVLPTIRSRCQRLAFGELPVEVVAEILTAYFGMAPGDAERLAALSGGSLSRAILLGQEGILETRGWALDLVDLERDDLIGRLTEEVLVDSRRWDARRVRHVAEVLLTWYRDVLALKYGKPDVPLTNRDRLSRLTTQAARLEAAEIGRRVRAMEGLVQAVESQVTPALALFTALTDDAMTTEDGQWLRP